MKKLALIVSAFFLLFMVAAQSQDKPKTTVPEEPPGPTTGTATDPFVKKKGDKPADVTTKTGPDTFINVGTLFQYIDVKREHWQKWLSENETPLDAGPLRREVEAWLSNGDAALAETSLIMGKSGQRAKVESIREIFYPTKFYSNEDGEVPGRFETRNAGTTSEIDPILNPGGIVDLNFAPERVFYLDEYPPIKENGVESGDIRWPRFVSQKVSCQVSLGSEQWALIGSETSLDRAETHQTLIFTRPVLHEFEEQPSESDTTGQGILTFQWIEVGHDVLNNWLMAEGEISPLIGGGIHRKALESGEISLDERIVRFRSGQRVKNESIQEVIYPTFATEPLRETRNVGTTVEVDPVFNAKGTVLDLNMAPDKVFDFGQTVHHRILVNGEWKPNVTMPVFYTMKASTQLSLPLNTPVLIAVMSPPDENGVLDASRKVLLFVKVSR